MKNKSFKTTLRYFTIAEWEKEQEYLRREHNKGWKFTGVTLPGFYHFEKCQPEDVVYQLDYNPEGTDHKEEYVQMFQDCGWEYVTDFVGYSYFRKADSQMRGHEEIFCDTQSRLDMIRRVFKGRMVPLIIIFFLLVIPQIFSHPWTDTPADYILAGMFLLIFIIYSLLFIHFAVKYYQCIKSMP